MYLRLTITGFSLCVLFLTPTYFTKAAVLYEQSKTGTPYDIFKNVEGSSTGLYVKMPQYNGEMPFYPGGGYFYNGTAEWLRVKRLSGLGCDSPFTITVIATDGNSQIGYIHPRSGLANGDYCDFPITGINRTDMAVGAIFICLNGDCDNLSQSFVLDGSQENPGFVLDGTQTIFKPGGWAFQICDIEGCSGGFASTSATSTGSGSGTTTATTTGASSVLFLPGIQASLLESNDDQLWLPTRNQDVEQLAMDDDGNSVNEIYTTGIMANIPFGGTVYDSFARYMVNLVEDRVIAGWTPFAYDWRYGIEDVANNGTKYKEGIRDIISEIEYLAQHSFSGQVTIIGHSNGGLLAKAVLQKLEADNKANLIDKVIFLASPQLGTPKSLGTILHGFDQEKLGGWLIDDVTARSVIKNMPGAYGLVTSEKYLNSTEDKIIIFDNSSSTESFRNNYGNAIDSVEELKRFMIGDSDGRPQAITIDEVLNVNEKLLSKQLNLHKDSLDNWQAPQGVQVVEIVGTGLDTVSGFEYRGFSERICTVFVVCQIENFYKPIPIISQKGDKTVMTMSAEGYAGNKEKYFVDLNAIEDDGGNSEHYNISENLSVQKLINNLLTATTSDIEFISNVAMSNNNSRVMFGVHSPVDIELTDSAGQRVGKKIIDGVVVKEESISGSSYFEIGTSKYIIVPKDNKYEIKVTGTGEGGLTFTEDELTGEIQTAKYSISIATITASTTIKSTFTDDLSNLEIDNNGDGNIDQVLTPFEFDVTPVITYRDLKNKIAGLSLSQGRKLPLLVFVNKAQEMDNKSTIDSKFKKLELLALKQLELLLINYEKKKWISQTDLEELIFIINKLK